jgi:hypothetical protein
MREAEGMTEAPDDAEAPPPPRSRGRVRTVLAVGILLAVVGVTAYLLTRPELAGPGSVTPPGDAPVGASPAHFCARYADVVGVDDGRSVRDWANAMAKVGTPAGLAARGRAGFELILAKAQTAKEDATLADLTKQQTHLNDGQTAQVEAFTEYATRTCASELERALREAASSSLPS